MERRAKVVAVSNVVSRSGAWASGLSICHLSSGPALPLSKKCVPTCIQGPGGMPLTRIGGSEKMSSHPHSPARINGSEMRKLRIQHAFGLKN